MGCCPLQVSDITVVLGTSMTLTVDNVQLKDYKFYSLVIAQEFPANVGTEPVSLSIGGVLYPLIDNAGNVVVAGKLRGGRLVGPCNVQGSQYRIQYGSNGLPTAIPHFVVHCGLCCMIYNGSAGATPPVAESVGGGGKRRDG